jgi:hypothetical protein
LGAQPTAAPFAVTDGHLCRRCRSSLVDDDVIGVSHRPAGKDAGVPSRRCSRCGWVNVEQPLISQLPLRALLERFPQWHDVIYDSGDFQEVRELLGGLCSVVLNSVNAEVERSPRMAAAWMLGLLDQLYDADAATGFRDLPAKSLQLVYVLHLSISGPLIVSDRAEELTPYWRDDADEALRAYLLLSEFLREAGLGLPIRVVDGVATATHSDRDVWALEVNLNIHVQSATAEAPDLSVSEGDAAEAERETFGYAMPDFLELMGDPEGLRARTRVSTGADLIVIDLGERADPLVRRMAADFTLTHDRLRRSVVPSYFFAAGDTEFRGDPEIIGQARDIDWLLYSPLLAADYFEGGRRGHAAVTSGYLLHRSRARADSAVAYRLHMASQAAQGRQADPGLAKRVRSIGRRAHAAFEQAIALDFQRAGWSVVCSLDEVHGRALPCGEIDAIGAAQKRAGQPLLVVVEAKNTDLTFYKDLGHQQAQATMERAFLQADRKATWVAANWSDIAALLEQEWTSAPLVIAIVVSRSAALPLGRSGPANIARRDIGAMLTTLLEDSPDAWRPDYRGAIVRS